MRLTYNLSSPDTSEAHIRTALRKAVQSTNGEMLLTFLAKNSGEHVFMWKKFICKEHMMRSSVRNRFHAHTIRLLKFTLEINDPI